MASSRGANKAQAVGKLQPSAVKGRRRGSRELTGLYRQQAQRIDLLTRFRARLAPPPEITEDKTAGPDRYTAKSDSVRKCREAWGDTCAAHEGGHMCEEDAGHPGSHSCGRRDRTTGGLCGATR